MTQYVTAPQCIVQIYPFEGGTYTLTSAQNGVLQADVSKNIRGQVGTFSLYLAPGGPNGPNKRPSWTDLITPMSLVVIGFRRGSYQQISMIGVVRNCREIQSWRPERNVSRVVSVEGVDFQYFFTLPSYYTLSFLGGVTAGAIGGGVGLTALLSDSLLTGTPDKFGAAWYQKIMAGPNSIMNDLSFAYQGSRVKFYDLLAQYWQPYPSSVDIPYADYFMLSEGTWQSKFMQVFPFPWYEFFVITATPGYYPGVSAGNTGYTDPSSFLTIPGFFPAVPQIVARVNPLPLVSDPNFAIDTTAWNALPNYTTDEISGVQHSIEFSDDEVFNFFVVNPTWLTNQFGGSNAATAPFIYTFAAWVDTASIHRYGYRPHIAELQWFSDPTGAQAKALNAAGKSTADVQTLVQQLALRQASYFEPAPNMARGEITTRLRPDILPGVRFTFTPYKDNEQWQFYIEGVSHSYVFGQHSTTTLSLARGLPLSVYEDSALLAKLHTGNAQRLNGTYTNGIPSGLGNGLTPINYQNYQAVVGGLASIYSTPQS